MNEGNTRIREGNRAIAEFMQLEVFNVCIQDGWGRVSLKGSTASITDGYRIEKAFGIPEHHQKGAAVPMWALFGEEHCLRYHNDWNWLMPVVEKIERMGCIIEIWLCLGKGCRITKGSFKAPVVEIANTESNSAIEAVYSAVLSFLTYFTDKTVNEK